MKVTEYFKNLKGEKIQGITMRWLINILGVIAVFFLIVFIVSTFAIKTYYYDSVTNIVKSGASTTAANYFSMYLENGSTLEVSTADFVENYSYKDRTTVWIIDADGNVIASSSGFSVDKMEMQDYTEAQISEDGTGKWVGKLPSGEKVMAISRVITKNGMEVGAVRVLTSLEKVDNQIATMCLLIAIGLLIVFAIIILSNLFFIRSIIFPIQEVTDTTKLIAKGNFNARIEKKYDDEIGDLCDSINSMAEEISTADKMKNDFLSTISHELRTPLTSIKGWAETLTTGNNVRHDEITDKGLKIIVSESGRLEGFVEELLDFSRLQSGRMKLRLEKCDIIAELDETIFTFKDRAMREGIEVKYSAPFTAAPANADTNRLKQVFLNILDNALKYSNPKGKIFVKAEFAQKDEKNFIKIAIVDQGCGISAQDLPHVKEKFYKANLSVKGSGIGLAVTNELVELHGGTLDIDSVENSGTFVTIMLPLINYDSEGNEINE